MLVKKYMIVFINIDHLRTGKSIILTASIMKHTHSSIGEGNCCGMKKSLINDKSFKMKWNRKRYVVC